MFAHTEVQGHWAIFLHLETCHPAEFPITHKCNKFCEYFRIADDFDVEVDMSISTANRPATPTNGKRKAEPSDEDESCSRRRKPN
jgi:hypothetical protein